MIRLLLLFLLISVEVNQVIGHGYLLKPPARATAWRVGFPTPVDYTDNGLNCGGFGTQWNVNGGKCGICGDPWNAVVKENEAPGGKYATGTIVANYTEGQVIDIDVKITTNHKGWFEFKLCKNNNIHQDSDQSCFDKHLLEFADGGTRVNVGEGRKVFSYKVRLPQGVTCDQCVVQWHYNGGNNWGCDSDTGKCCVGCGPQETFWGCADVTITKGGSAHQPSTRKPQTHEPTIHADTVEPKETTFAPKPSGDCKAIPPYDVQDGMDEWCNENCLVGNCPATMCSCT